MTSLTASSAAPRCLGRRLAAAAAAATTVAAVLTSAAASQAAPEQAATTIGPAAPTSVTVSNSAPGTAPGALVDGSFAAGTAGAQWSASPDDSSAWVRFSWASPRQVATVQILGPAQPAAPRNWPGDSALRGRLVFSDGSTVPVSSIAGGGTDPTTIAFTPRQASWVTLELSKVVPTAVLGLQELAVYDAGILAPRWPVKTVGFSTIPAAARCSMSSPPVFTGTRDGLGLICPTPGTAVSTSAKVVVSAPAGTPLAASTLRLDGSPQGVIRQVASTVTRSDRRAVLTIDTRNLPRGPIALRIVRTDKPVAQRTPLYVQLINNGGRAMSAPSTAPDGMSLVYAEEFSDPLSASGSGVDASYATTKPEPWGSSHFGMAVFANPARGGDNIATIPGGYLQLGVRPIEGSNHKGSWGQQHIGGIVSSTHVGGSGFSAQYGYFEARILGAPGPGAWPAFWMLNAGNAAPQDSGRAAEVDAVELYGHDTAGSCHTSHSWVRGKGDVDGSSGLCARIVQPSDWAMSWHTYGARIVPGATILYVDGVEVAHLTGLTHTEEPFYFLLNLALSPDWPIDLAATGNRTDMYVDWVRVYV